MKRFIEYWKYDLLIFIGFIILIFGIGYTIQTDFYLHTEHVLKINEGIKTYPPNFIYYLLVHVLTGFTDDYITAYSCTLFLVAISLFIKYYITKMYFFELKYNKVLILFIALACSLYFSVPDPLGILHNTFYLGRFVPNLFHNSTLLLSMPVTLLLFMKQIVIIKRNYVVSKKEWLVIFILITLQVFSKPSYLFAFIPTCLLFITLNKIKESVVVVAKTMFVYILGIVLIFGSTIIIYKYGVGDYSQEKSQILISLFENHKAYYPFWYFPIVILCSFLFPIVYIIYNHRNIGKNTELLFALVCLIVGLFIGFLVSEVGPRKGDGNFLWQIVACYYVLLIVMVKNWLMKIQNKEIDLLEHRVLATCFTLHVLSGGYYIFSLFYFRHI